MGGGGGGGGGGGRGKGGGGGGDAARGGWSAAASSLDAPEVLGDELHVLLEPLRSHWVVQEILQEDARAIAPDAVVAASKHELGEAAKKRGRTEQRTEDRMGAHKRA